MTTKQKLEKLEKERVAFLEKHLEKVKKVKLNCKHNYKYYEHHYNNYDQDISNGYKCSKCDSDVSKYDYERLHK